jgi:hypothetical protein
MRLRIVSADGDADPVVALYSWLCQDPDVAATATLSLDGCADEFGGMCSGNEEINVGVSNSLPAVSAVLAAVSRWRSTRSWAPELNVEARTTMIVVASDDPVALRVSAERLLAAAPR